MSDTTGDTEAVSEVERIGQIIAAGDYDVHLERVGEEDQQIERLLIDLGEDAEDRRYTLQIFFLSDVTDAAGLVGDDEGFDNVLLHFFTVLPFEIDEDHMLEAYRIANMASRLMPIGQVGVSEEDGLFYYTYTLVVDTREVPAQVIQEVVTSMAFGIGSYGPALDNVAKGELTVSEFNQALADEGLNLMTNPGSA